MEVKKSASRKSLRLLEGSRAVAEAVKLCRPHLVAAYPITPQTHIVEQLAQIIADGELKAEFLNVESEHSAASVVLGASATGARVFTATSSQGLILMAEVIYNIAGLRLPVVLTCANRALSAPLNIWNDQQDAMVVRDAGCIMVFAEDVQEAADLHIQAYRIAEDYRVLLPVMVNMDGFILTHIYEPVALPSQEEVDSFLPPYQPLYYLTPRSPLTLGAFTEPDKYLETRYLLQRAMERAQGVVVEVAEKFEKSFGRRSGGLFEEYCTSDATHVLVAMGSIVSTLREAVDELRDQGKKAGLLKLVCYRPFPAKELRLALARAQRVTVVEKALCPGGVGILTADLKAALYGLSQPPQVSLFVAGLGGRDVSAAALKVAYTLAEEGERELEFLELNREQVGEE